MSTSTTPDPLGPFKQLLSAGFPAWQIADQVRRHLDGLRALPADTEGREQAIEQAQAFLADLPPRPEDIH